MHGSPFYFDADVVLVPHEVTVTVGVCIHVGPPGESRVTLHVTDDTTLQVEIAFTFEIHTK